MAKIHEKAPDGKSPPHVQAEGSLLLIKQQSEARMSAMLQQMNMDALAAAFNAGVEWQKKQEQK